MYRKNKRKSRSKHKRSLTLIDDRVMDDRAMNLERRRKTDNDMFDRIALERSFTSYGSDDDYDNNIGELTHQPMVNDDDFNVPGMPNYGSFKPKESKYDQNDHFNFKVNRKLKSSEKNMLYNDDYDYDDNNYRQYSRVDEHKSLYDNDNNDIGNSYDRFIDNINFMTLTMFRTLSMVNGKSFVINGYGLTNIMGVMYMLSQTNIQDAFESTFNFTNKKGLNAGLITLRNQCNISSIRQYFTIDSYIISPSFIDINTTIASQLKKLVFPLVMNPRQAMYEKERINEIILKLSGIDNILSAKTLSNVSNGLLLLNVCKFNIRIKNQKGMRIMYNNDTFYKYSHKEAKTIKIQMKFINLYNVKCLYYETSSCKTIEIPLVSDHVLGILIGDDFANFNPQILMNNMRNLVEVEFSEIMIPMIDNIYKMRLNSILKNTNINDIFVQNDYSKLYPDEININDIVQIHKVKFTASSNIKKTNNGVYNGERFYANREFLFYVKDKNTNLIKLISIY